MMSYPYNPHAGSSASGPPPPPPPKPSSHPTSGQSTPHNGPPLPPPPPNASSQEAQSLQFPQQQPQIPPPTLEEGWLPEILKDKTKPDLEAILQDQALLSSVLNSPNTAHPSLQASVAPIQAALAQNISLSQHVLSLSNNLAQQRADITAKLLSMRALERQWHLKQTAMDDALSPFAPKAVHTRLVTGIQDQAALLRAMEDSFLEEEGIASERETAEFLRRWREGRKVLSLREERRARFDEGRVGGWR